MAKHEKYIVLVTYDDLSKNVKNAILTYNSTCALTFFDTGAIGGGGEGGRIMRYDLFVEERYNVSRISDTYKKSFICTLLKYRYIPHINNLLLIPDLCVRPMKTCL